MAKKKKRGSFYGVHRGRVPGVYDSWESCRAHVEGCANQHRRFVTYDEAAFYVATGQTRNGEARAARLAKWKRTQQLSASSGIPRVKRKEEKEEAPCIKIESFDASQSFFSQQPDFKPDDKADFDDEFGRFASSQNIPRGSKAWREKRTDAIRHEMIFHYSQKVDSDDEDDIKEEGETGLRIGLSYEGKLKVFQNMCREVSLEPLDTIEGCVSNLKSVLVNIVDYIDARRNARPIKVWPPHEFEAFKRYTLSDEKRMDLQAARGGDGFIAALLQVLKPPGAAKIYQGRRDRAVVAREDCASRVLYMTDYDREQHLEDIKEESSITDEIPDHQLDVVSIHGTESDYSSSPRPVKEEQEGEEETARLDACPWSPSSMGSSVVEILLSSQIGTKRSLDDLTQDQDDSQDDIILVSAHKRART